jgi:hypothetical protein
LLGGAPNPFNPTTAIRFELAERARVALEVFDVRGCIVRRLVDEELPAGPYQVLWKGRSDDEMEVASGIYFVRMTSGNFVSSRKLTLLR